MKLLVIIEKEIKQNLRNKRTMFFMIAFPILFTIIFSYTFTNNEIASVEKPYKVSVVDFKEDDVVKLKNFLSDVGYHNVELMQDAKQDKETADGYLGEITFDKDKLSFIKNNDYSTEANVFEILLKGYYDYSLQESSNSKNTTISVSNKDNIYAGKNYYGISMLTIAIIFSSYIASLSIKSERRINTNVRISMTPVSTKSIVLGKIIGNFIVISFEILISVIFAKYGMKIFFGEHLFTILLILAAEIMLATSMGICLAFRVNNDSSISGILAIVTNALVFLGGGYISVEKFGPVINTISKCTPLRWINQSIFNIIYYQDYSSLKIAVAITISCSFIFILITFIGGERKKI